ncbi:hypothetical protein ACFQZJ_00955 [Maribacter chungangensis]|uniref:YARHG domain-containing protein n=1 Tax=Maribacter chungangensis TaxID=1069117 RepID=A0ABW3AY45_9FLAO
MQLNILKVVLCISFTFLQIGSLNAQINKSNLFHSQSPLTLKLEYSKKQLKKETDKKTHILSELMYKNGATWDTLPITLRARGNFRRGNCFFPPIKMYFEKGSNKESLFKGHKNVKLVLPCLLEDRSNDDVLKEYLAYKSYEILSDIHFKTRLASIEYTDTRGQKAEIHPLAAFMPQPTLEEINDYGGETAFASRKAKTYILLAIIIEDDKVVAKRHDAKILKRVVHPLNQEERNSITNAMFQYMIGNTDFSTAYQHNQKLLFKEGQILPVPYDFDMSGLVNASYAVVSNINNSPLNISKVTQRQFRGFKRDMVSFEKVRQHFLQKQPEIFKLFSEYEPFFKDKASYRKAKGFIDSFFDILKDDVQYNKRILQAARLK